MTGEFAAAQAARNAEEAEDDGEDWEAIFAPDAAPVGVVPPELEAEEIATILEAQNHLDLMFAAELSTDPVVEKDKE